MSTIVEYKQQFTLSYYAKDAEVYHSPLGEIPYLREPGVVLLAQTATYLEPLCQFLKGLGEEFVGYLDDPITLDSGTALSKFAGQICYIALGEKRTKNDEAQKYFKNIKEQQHGSVLEHPVYTFLLYGIDRAVTHEWVRHRVGKAYSQVSQRYVGPDKLRYVMPAEFQGDPEGEQIFFEQIQGNRNHYIRRIEYMARRSEDLPGESKTEKRKRMQGFARRALANEVEAPIVISGNVRAWRHVITKRAARAADRPIRSPAITVLQMLQKVNNTAFEDFYTTTLPDGTIAAQPEFQSV